jgi:IS5 family transposase
MRKKAERQLPLDFAGTQKLTKEWYSLYKNIHAILEQNPAVTDLVHADLTAGEKKLNRNVEGVASESILRLALVQQIEQLSFRETIVRVDDSQMLRFFCRFYDDTVVSHSLYATLVNMITPATWEKINELIVRFARDKKGFKGKRLRIDTTAVESDIHFPMDSSLLCDCIRVLSRLIGRARKIDECLMGQWRSRLKNAKRLNQMLLRGGKNLHKATRKCWYKKLLDSTQRAMFKAQEVRARIENRRWCNRLSRGTSKSSAINRNAWRGTRDFIRRPWWKKWSAAEWSMSVYRKRAGATRTRKRERKVFGLRRRRHFARGSKGRCLS